MSEKTFVFFKQAPHPLLTTVVNSDHAQLKGTCVLYMFNLQMVKAALLSCVTANIFCSQHEFVRQMLS